jgi:hypothetical protein
MKLIDRGQSQMALLTSLGASCLDSMPTVILEIEDLDISDAASQSRIQVPGGKAVCFFCVCLSAVALCLPQLRSLLEVFTTCPQGPDMLFLDCDEDNKSAIETKECLKSVSYTRKESIHI